MSLALPPDDYFKQVIDRPPLVKLRAHLKQMSFGALSESRRALFAAFIPRFFDPSPAANTESIAKAAEPFAPFITVEEAEVPRRFGGAHLPRNRYYVLSRDLFGADDETLANELRAYRNPIRHGMVEVLDFGLGDGFTLMLDPNTTLKRFSRSSEIGLLIHGPERVKDVLRGHEFEVIEHAGDSLFALVRFPYMVDKVEIDNIVDLREPLARTWFEQQFSRWDDDWTWPESYAVPMPERPKRIESGWRRTFERAPVPKAFRDMLPTLLNPKLGGGDYHWGGITLDAIGQWMRNHKISGLVYPSARSDVYVTVDDGKVVDYRGWCFVDFRPADDQQRLRAPWIDMSPWSWVGFRWGVTSIFPDWNSSKAGSFAIEGVTEAASRSYRGAIESLVRAERDIGLFRLRFSLLDGYLLGSYSIRWLRAFYRLLGPAPLSVETSEEDAENALLVVRGLLLRNGLPEFADDLGEIIAELHDRHNVPSAVRDLTGLMSDLAVVLDRDRKQFVRVIRAGAALQSSLLALDQLSVGGQGVLSKSEQGALESLDVPAELHEEILEFNRMLDEPASRLQLCLERGGLLDAKLQKYFAEHPA